MHITFPEYSGIRCLMMPYVQGDPESLPAEYAPYRDIVASTYLERSEIGYLTIDESPIVAGAPHRGARAKHGRALHTEAGICHGRYRWGGSPPRPTWGGREAVTLDYGTRVLLASSIANTTAIWDAEHPDTTDDGDIGHLASLYPYDRAKILQAGEVAEIGILTPHESLPAATSGNRQFLRIVGAGVHGREHYFTVNPLINKE